MRFRPLVPAAVLACALAALLTGCGGDSVEEGTGASPEALEKVAASDYARAVNIKQSDVPYFEVDEDEEDEDPEKEERESRELEECIGGGFDETEPLAEVSSPNFDTSSGASVLGLESTVAVEPDGTKLVDEFEILTSRRALFCLQKTFIRQIKESDSVEFEVSDAKLTRIPFPGPKADARAAFRLVMTVTATGATEQQVAFRSSDPAVERVSIKFFFDIFFFVSGRAVVSLYTYGTPTPVSRNFQRGLLRVLHERAVAEAP